jgi:hypothetical protein
MAGFSGFEFSGFESAEADSINGAGRRVRFCRLACVPL